MAGYLGSTPVPQATQHRESFTATAAQTTFATAGYTAGFVDVYLNGVHLTPADVTATNGSDVVLGACLVNDIVDVISHSAFELNAQTFTGTTTMTDVVAASLDISGNIDIDGTTNLDVVDIDGAVNMATTALVTGVLTTTDATVFNGGFAANDGSTISTADNTAQLTLISTDADAAVGPLVKLLRNSGSPADNDYIGRLQFLGINDNSQEYAGVDFLARAIDVSDGSEDATLFINVMTGGGAYNRITIAPTELVLNDESRDVNFRVETDANPNAFFVEASGTGALIIGQNTTALTQNVAYFAGDYNSGGHFHFAVGNTTTNAGFSVMYLNRQGSDGVLIEFLHADSAEGTISVSGSTVSYNGFAGRHESSGIATNTAVGTVVSTIDELDVYPDTQTDREGGMMASPKAGQTRANHAKVKVSDSVGDNRVYGVVDNFETSGKVNIISVGIGSVRVTGACVGGDLLESNGDGTAKVQSDDIVRSKTIGKVTISNSNTGVKLVSCVMYCG